MSIEMTCKRQVFEINGNVYCQFAMESNDEHSCDICCKNCTEKCEKECIFSKRNQSNLDD